MTKRYFKNLNGIRFILATLVLIHHVAIVLQVLQVSNLYNKIGALKAFGPVAVSLFFALSGFLITYLLLEENKNTNTIVLKKFYLSRARRILPLYYFIVIIHLFILPYTPLISMEHKLILMDANAYQYAAIPLQGWELNIWYLLLLPQVALALMVATGNTFVPAGHVWSIGVEEIFYFTYPVLLKKYIHKFRKLILSTIAIYYTLAILVFVIAQLVKMGYITDIKILRIVNFSIILILYNRINCMVIGAVGAYLYFKRHKYYFTATQPKVFYASIIGILLLFAVGARVPFITHELYCILFTCVILYLIKDGKNYFLENAVFTYLGKISYGIYMYQMVVIFFITHLCTKYHLHPLWVYPLSFVLTVLISAVSYEFIERKIMKK